MKEAPAPLPPADEAELSGKRRVARIGMAIGVVLGLGISILYIKDRTILSALAPWQWPVVLVGSFYAIIISHELGHLIAGWLMGFELNLFHISPISLQRKPTGWKLVFNTKVQAVGYISMIPRSYERIHQRLRNFILGGPLGNLALNVICGIVLSQPLAPVWQRFFTLTAGLSLLLGLLNLIPFEDKHLQSDGARLKMIRHQPQQAERWIAAISLSSAMVRGVRPRDWDAAAVERALACPDRSQDHILALLMAYMWAEDHDNYDQSQAYIEHLLTTYPYASPHHQAVILAQGAFFYSYRRHNLNLARDCWNRLKPLGQHIPHQTLVYIRTTLLAAEGRLGEARERLQEYMQIRQEHPYAWLREGEAEWLATMRSVLNGVEAPVSA
jgi:Zn-dependent protease